MRLGAVPGEVVCNRGVKTEKTRQVVCVGPRYAA